MPTIGSSKLRVEPLPPSPLATAAVEDRGRQGRAGTPAGRLRRSSAITDTRRPVAFSPDVSMRVGSDGIDLPADQPSPVREPVALVGHQHGDVGSAAGKEGEERDAVGQDGDRDRVQRQQAAVPASGTRPMLTAITSTRRPIRMIAKTTINNRPSLLGAGAGYC